MKSNDCWNHPKKQLLRNSHYPEAFFITSHDLFVDKSKHLNEWGHSIETLLRSARDASSQAPLGIRRVAVAKVTHRTDNPSPRSMLLKVQCSETLIVFGWNIAKGVSSSRDRFHTEYGNSLEHRRTQIQVRTYNHNSFGGKTIRSSWIYLGCPGVN